MLSIKHCLHVMRISLLFCSFFNWPDCLSLGLVLFPTSFSSSLPQTTLQYSTLLAHNNIDFFHYFSLSDDCPISLFQCSFVLFTIPYRPTDIQWLQRALSVHLLELGRWRLPPLIQAVQVSLFRKTRASLQKRKQFYSLSRAQSLALFRNAGWVLSPLHITR